MDERRAQAGTAADRRHQRRRRVKRGVVAGYIHEISARHQAAGPLGIERRGLRLATSQS